MRRAIVITGPTGGGKSALALAIAARIGGVIINADSMQVYRELRVVTARPSLADEAASSHRLYGHVPASEAYSAGRFVIEAAVEIERARAAGFVPIIAGGTGLYLQALLIGLSPIPPVPAEIRARWRDRAGLVPTSELHAELAARDPVMAARLRPADVQRVVRALEVLEATGQSLAHWQAQAGTPALPLEQTVRIAVAPPRAELYARCDRRIEAMLAAGLVDEIAALGRLGLADAVPAMRAVGVPPLLRHVRGEIGLDEAVGAMRTDTRRYIKRQLTWLRRTIFTFDRIIPQLSECETVHICSILNVGLDHLPEEP